MPIARRLVAVVTAALLLGACMSNDEKAAAYEAQYDRLMGVKAYPPALKSIQIAVAADDSSARRYIKLAEVQLAMGRPADAAASYQRALDLEPDNIGALQNMSLLAVRGGQFDLARRYIDPLLALSPNDPAGLLAQGAMAMGQRRFKDAIALADQIASALPDRPDGFVLKARALDALGRSRDAVKTIEARAATAGDSKELLAQLMISYRKLGDVKGIRATAIRMMPLVPDEPRYAFEAARAYQAEGKQSQADTIIADLRERFATSADVLIAIGDFWHDTLPRAEAAERIAALAAASPPRQRIALADQLIDYGAPENAIALLDPLAPATVTTRNMDAQTHLARALFQSGRLAAASAKVDSALAQDARNPEALLLRSRLRLRARDFRGAFTDAQVVTNDDETNEEAALLVAEIYAAQGNQMLAAGAYGNARQQFPDSMTSLRAEVNWLLSQNRAAEAGQRVVSFRNTHGRNVEATRFAHDVCRQTNAPACRKPAAEMINLLG